MWGHDKTVNELPHELVRAVSADTDAVSCCVAQEANRESAARSRDKRLKLIADLETEVQELKRQHEAFKVLPRVPTC